MSLSGTLDGRHNEGVTPLSRSKVGLKGDFKNPIKFLVGNSFFEDRFQVVNLQRDNFHAVDEVVVVSGIVVSLIFLSAKVGDNIDVQFVGSENAVGVWVMRAQYVVTEMSGYKLHFHATLIGAVGERCLK